MKKMFKKKIDIWQLILIYEISNKWIFKNIIIFPVNPQIKIVNKIAKIFHRWENIDLKKNPNKTKLTMYPEGPTIYLIQNSGPLRFLPSPQWPLARTLWPISLLVRSVHFDSFPSQMSTLWPIIHWVIVTHSTPSQVIVTSRTSNDHTMTPISSKQYIMIHYSSNDYIMTHFILQISTLWLLKSPSESIMTHKPSFSSCSLRIRVGAAPAWGWPHTLPSGGRCRQWTGWGARTARRSGNPQATR